MILGVIASGIILFPQTTSSAGEIRVACSNTTEMPSLPSLALTDFPALAGDLPGILVTDRNSGGHLKIYYDARSERSARQRAACLGAQIGLLQDVLADNRRNVEWSSVVFAAPGYVAPSGGVTRWHVPINDGEIDPADDEMICVTLPHEQVHAFQMRAASMGHRWIMEGHATWAGSKVAMQLRPDLAEAETESLQEALRTTTEPLGLKRWGFPRIKRSAVRRQVPSDIQDRMDAEPDFWPAGAFEFKPDDFESDESNTRARYAAAAAIFAGLEIRHGLAAVQSWVRDATAREEPVTSAAMSSSAMTRFGEDISPLLD